MKNLLEKKIDVHTQSKIYGGGSGGTESGSTNGGSDGYEREYDDNCNLASETICYF